MDWINIKLDRSAYNWLNYIKAEQAARQAARVTLSDVVMMLASLYRDSARSRMDGGNMSLALAEATQSSSHEQSTEDAHEKAALA